MSSIYSLDEVRKECQIVGSFVEVSVKSEL